MADYKLSELNSIDTIRSDDLLHVRVKKRPEMLGDEDRRMTYQDFLASFKLERFVQIAGSTMTGDLGIVKLLYGGKAVFDPTGSSEITMGDVLKTFKLNANGLKLTIADASRSATVYHTLNKPSPNELGMRTNEENDARYARLAVNNTFRGTQAILSDNEALIIKNITQGTPLYLRGQDADGTNRWYLGNDNRGTHNLVLKNVKTDVSIAISENLVTVNRTLQIAGQVQPSSFANLDARYFTQTVANQRFAQLAGNNTFTGANTFRTMSVISNAAAITLQCASANESLYLLAKDYEGGNLWYLGKGSSGAGVTIYNYTTNTSLVLDAAGVSANKNVRITGQVQPSDWTNIDSRYIPAATLSTIARTNATNTFSVRQVINSDGEALALKAKTATTLFIRGLAADGTAKWYVGNGDADNNNNLRLFNYKTGKGLTIGSTFEMNATLAITGQVKPSDWSNLDARYFTQSVANQKFMYAGSTGTGTEVGDSDGIAWNAKTGLYNVTGYSGGSTQLVFQMYQGASSTPSAQLKFNYRNGGFWYRSSRDGFGFEEDFTQIYTEKYKPTPSAIGAYTKAETDQKIAQAVSDSTDLNKIYPVGIVTWFNSNVNPNTALPGLTWTYLNNGVGRTIRIAAANGSDVATTGGSDSVTLAVGNLPSHTHSFSATTSSFDYGTKTTDTTGAHTHSVSGSTNNTGAHTHTVGGHYGGDSIGGKQRVQASGTAQVSSVAGDHSHTVSGTAASNGDHAHTVGIGAHSHTVSGNTGSTGSGSAFSITNQFYKLMAWVRTA
ncbi:tail fiber protein [Enterobacteria phage UAB_Phi87]|uniref:Tail fiber protein n=1 Tax=Enterobacteria phage UAB_Phi87 TaxID=1197935 RepID=M1FQ44_9CAUD|nr:tail fiber protein [Enterobacteria phage UAB_Phi87]AFQ96160.1 tail fiber protein [Enterobacteria phage UAB_Phi87]